MLISRPDRSSLVDEDFAPDWVIVDLNSGQYYCLNESAAFVWITLKSEPKSLGRIHHELAHRFIVDTPVAQSETESFILLMEKANLLVVDRMGTTGELPAETNATLASQAPWVTPSFTTYTELEDLITIDPIHEVNDQTGWPNPNTGTEKPPE